MAISIACQSVWTANGKLYVRWSDKTVQEFSSTSDLTDFIQDSLSVDVLRAIGLRKATDAGVSLANLQALAGKTITADTSLANNVVRYT